MQILDSFWLIPIDDLIAYDSLPLCEAVSKPLTLVPLWAGYLTAVLLHGFYDACAMIGTRAAMLIFMGFVVVMFLLVFWIVKNESYLDQHM